MPLIKISAGLDMHYERDDYTDPWTTPETILMLHGNAESSAVWYGWVPHLARRYRVIRPDMRGFGRSTPMPREFPWSLDRIVDDYVELMQGLGLARAHLVAAKLGGHGRAALCCALSRAGRNVDGGRHTTAQPRRASRDRARMAGRLREERR